MLMANSSTSLLQGCSLIVVCPELCHRALTNTASPTPFLLTFSFILSVYIILKPCDAAFMSEVIAVSHLCEQHHATILLFPLLPSQQSWSIHRIAERSHIPCDDRGEDWFIMSLTSKALSPGTLFASLPPQQGTSGLSTFHDYQPNIYLCPLRFCVYDVKVDKLCTTIFANFLTPHECPINVSSLRLMFQSTHGSSSSVGLSAVLTNITELNAPRKEAVKSWI